MKKGKKAILAIAVVGLFGMAVIPMGASAQGNWIDTFDSYTDGQFLDGTADDGGWKGWDNDPAYGAYVTSAMSVSSPHSVDISGPTDLVHEFSGYTSGQWTWYSQVYVPGDTEGDSYFILLSHYEDGGGQEGNEWAVQVRFDIESEVVEAEHDGEQLPLITDQWVQFRIEIDLDNDWFECYYGGNLLQEKEWTATPNNDMGGFLEIGAVDLYANGATSVYYDNIGIVETGKFLGVGGSLNWVEIEPGATVTGEFTIQNIVPGADPIDWEVASYPSWGTWTFTPSSGEGLSNADGPVTVAVEVVAPSDANQDFSGEIKVVNKANPDDFGTVPVSLATPLSRNSLLLEFFEMLIQRFPLLERIFSLYIFQ